MPNCPRCDQLVDEPDAFCRRCGTALREAAPTERAAFMGELAAEYQSQLKDQPRDPDALYNLALSRLYAGQVRQAEEALRQVLELAPDFADAHGKLAVCLWNLGDREAARECLAQALSLAPTDRRLQDLQARMSAE